MIFLGIFLRGGGAKFKFAPGRQIPSLRHWKDWIITKKLNENLTARIQTNHGYTRKVEIKDSIRQGGILSVIQYAIS